MLNKKRKQSIEITNLRRALYVRKYRYAYFIKSNLKLISTLFLVKIIIIIFFFFLNNIQKRFDIQEVIV